MSDPANIAAALVDMTPRQRAEWLLERAQLAVEEARPGSVAYVQSLRAVARALGGEPARSWRSCAQPIRSPTTLRT